jgi:hypothetical protein
MADGAPTVQMVESRDAPTRDAPTRDAPTVEYSEAWAYVIRNGIPLFMDADCAPAPGVRIELCDVCKPNASSPPWELGTRELGTRELGTRELLTECTNPDYESDMVWGQGPSRSSNIHSLLSETDVVQLF